MPESPGVLLPGDSAHVCLVNLSDLWTCISRLPSSCKNNNNTPTVADPLDAGVGDQQPAVSLSYESGMAQGGWFQLVGGHLRPS